MQATGMNENKIASHKGGSIAKKAKVALENQTGKKIITSDNYLPQQKKILSKE